MTNQASGNVPHDKDRASYDSLQRLIDLTHELGLYTDCDDCQEGGHKNDYLVH